MSTFTLATSTESIVFADMPTVAVVDGWYFQGLEDWYAVTDSKSEIHERPQAHGAFGIAVDWRQAASFSADLIYLGVDRAAAVAAQNQFNRLSGGNKPITATFLDGGIATSRMVSIRNSRPEDGHGAAEVVLTTEMVATDPLRYGTPLPVSTGVPVAAGGLIYPLGSGSAYWDYGTGGVSGRIAVTNTGTAPVFPPFEVTGGLDGVVVTDVTTNQFVRLDRQIPAGSTAFFNQRTGRAYLDNVSSDISPFISSRGWFQIGPGETHQIQFQPLGAVVGSPTLTVRMSPAYL